jgi:hypothetical protein
VLWTATTRRSPPFRGFPEAASLARMIGLFATVAFWGRRTRILGAEPAGALEAADGAGLGNGEDAVLVGDGRGRSHRRSRRAFDLEAEASASPFPSGEA